MKSLRSDRSLLLLSAILVFLSVMFSFVSNHYESRVMGDAALGIAVLAPDRNSPEWSQKMSLRSKADCFFNLSILSGLLAVGIDFFLAFWTFEHANHRARTLSDDHK
ncbi:MAG: hypothetical protein WC855_09110 [Thermodesulfovibrionales bacterium]